ncbi:uncharacterized protein LOC144128899 [Amblyomma americanum]
MAVSSCLRPLNCVCYQEYPAAVQKQSGLGCVTERYRFAPYHQCVLRMGRRLGKNNRRPLPSCILKALTC